MKKILSGLLALGIAFGVAKAEDINVKVLGSSYLPNMNGGTPGSEVVFVNKSFDMDSVKTILNSQGRYAINNLYTGMSGIEDIGSNNAVGTTIVFNNTNLIYGGTDAKISLTNIKGADVSSNVSVQEENGFTTAFFNPNGLAKGTYFYKVEGKNGFKSVNRIVYDGSVVNDAHPQPSLIQKVTPQKSLEEVVRSSPKGGIHPGDVHTWYVGITSSDGSFAKFEDSLEVTIPSSSTDLVTLYPEHYLEWNENWRNIEGVIRNGHEYTIGGVDAKSPVSNANVTLVLNDNVIANVTTGADGKYEFKHVAGGNVYTIEVRDLAGEFRANKFLAEVSDRFFEADTVAVNRFFEHIADGYSGTGNFDQCLFEDAYEFLAKDTLGVRSISNPALFDYTNEGYDRIFEGQYDTMSDGGIWADNIMERVMKFYNPTSTQFKAIRSYFNLFQGIPYSEVDNLFQIVYTEIVPDINSTNVFSEENTNGYNLGTDGNNTDDWQSILTFSSDLYNVSSIISGADINSGGEEATWHELNNLRGTGVVSEASNEDADGGYPTINDICANQMTKEVKQSIYKDGIHSGTVYELKDSVPDRKFNINNENVFDLHK